MKQIRMIFNLDTSTWLIQRVSIEAGNNNLNLIITSSNGFWDFDNFSCGFTVDQGTTNILSKNYPKTGYSYEYIREEILDVQQIDLIYNHRYTINCWLENNNNKYESVSEFIAPPPAKPFDSWIWQDDKWVAPVPYPGKENSVFQWNESDQIWVEGPPPA